MSLYAQTASNDEFSALFEQWCDNQNSPKFELDSATKCEAIIEYSKYVLHDSLPQALVAQYIHEEYGSAFKENLISSLKKNITIADLKSSLSQGGSTAMTKILDRIVASVKSDDGKMLSSIYLLSVVSSNSTDIPYNVVPKNYQDAFRAFYSNCQMPNMVGTLLGVKNTQEVEQFRSSLKRQGISMTDLVENLMLLHCDAAKITEQELKNAASIAQSDASQRIMNSLLSYVEDLQSTNISMICAMGDWIVSKMTIPGENLEKTYQSLK